MAASKSYFVLTNRYLPNEKSSPINTDPLLELDESDIWNSGRSVSPEFRKPASRTKSAAAKKRVDVGVAASLPVKVPDWSKILKEEYNNNNNNNNNNSNSNKRRGESDDEFVTEEENRVAPHEYLARRRIASFSVHEGIGRTLKGRDLSRVRNAIWEKTGFQD